MMKKYNSKSFEDVKNFIEKEAGVNINKKFYLLSTEYVNNNTKLEIIDSDGYKYFSSYNNMYSSYKNNSVPRIVYKNNIYSIFNINLYIKRNNLRCELLSKVFIDNKSKLRFKCACGNEFYACWNAFKCDNKHQCNECGREKSTIAFTERQREKSRYIKELRLKSPKTLSKSEINRINQYNRIKDTLLKNNVLLLTKESEYVNTIGTICMKCNCGNIFYAPTSTYKRITQCQKCGNKNGTEKVRLSREQILNKLLVLGKNKSTIFTWLSGEHVNSKSKILISDSDGYKYSICAHYLFAKNRVCNFRKFDRHNPYTIENIKLWMKENSKGYDLLSGEYKGCFNKLTFKCPEGHLFETSWNKFRLGRRCIECVLSQGARMVYYYLKELSYDFEVEYRFKDCKYKNTLPFDFVVFNKDKSILCAIEFDGEFHYKPNTFSSATDKSIRTFEYTQIRDNIKNEYCKDNNIPLLRIPYWERDNGNIEIILNLFLSSPFSTRRKSA